MYNNVPYATTHTRILLKIRIVRSVGRLAKASRAFWGKMDRFLGVPLSWTKSSCALLVETIRVLFSQTRQVYDARCARAGKGGVAMGRDITVFSAERAQAGRDAQLLGEAG